MDRPIAYTGEINRSLDFMFAQRSTMIALAKMSKLALGTSTTAEGLGCIPTSPASLSVSIGLGQIYQVENVDATAYGVMPADITDTILKQGINLASTVLATTAPSTAGQSINYLVEAQYQDADTNPLVLPYYNAANPASPLSGASGSGAAQATQRQGIVALQLKSGVAAATGSQVTPAVDAGWIPLWVVTVANGQTQILAGNIVQATGAPLIGSITNFTAAPFVITAPATGVAYQNTTGAPLEILVSGGTVTAIQMSRNNTTFYSVGVIAGAVRLAPNDYLTLTYTVAPTLTGFPM